MTRYKPRAEQDRPWMRRYVAPLTLAAALMGAVGCSDEGAGTPNSDALVVEDVIDVTPSKDAGQVEDGQIDSQSPNADASDTTTNTAVQDSAVQDGAAEDSAVQDSAAQDSAAQDSAAQDSAAQDSATQDSATQDTAQADGGGPQDVAQDASADAGDTTFPTNDLYLLSFGAATTSGAIGPKPGKGTVPLYKIDVATGSGKTICALQTSDSYPSSTFGRDGKLYGSNNTQDRLDIIDPCGCTVTAVGKFGYSFIPGITSDQGVGLFGMENTVDILVAINPKTGKATKIGAYGVNFGNGGATWSDTLGGAYAIDGTSDSLYTLDSKTGKASLVVKLNKDFGTVGIELHPANDTIYACTSDSILYTVDPKTGSVSPIGKLPHKAACNNLAAPWSAVACLKKP